MLFRSINLRKKLHQAEKKTREALATVEANDKMKVHFLRTITYEVHIALNTVVGFSDILSSEKGLSQEELDDYSAMIKFNADRLITLINNVLDLSRLESGMMRFNWVKADVLQLCSEVKMMAEMQNNRPLNMRLDIKSDNLVINTDVRWFVKVLISLLANGSQKANCEEEFILKEYDKYITITICDCPDYRQNESEQEIRITDSINRLFLKSCKGNYELIESGQHRKIMITYPLA